MVRSVLCLLFQLFAYLYSIAQQSVIISQGIEDSIAQVIHLTSKSIIKDNKILLEWSTAGKNGFYIIERSFDSKDFEVIGALKAHNYGNNYEFMDEQPFMKRNYYRIKMEVSDEKSSYSNTITAGVADSIFCKFYPNPVDKLLILRSDYSVELRITDIAGKMRIIQQLKPGLQILDVSCLEKSIYVITIFHERSNRFIISKLIKN
jgi:hypothetical protein